MYDDPRVTLSQSRRFKACQSFNCETTKKFDIVLALDSYFTRFGTEQAKI